MYLLEYNVVQLKKLASALMIGDKKKVIIIHIEIKYFTRISFKGNFLFFPYISQKIARRMEKTTGYNNTKTIL